MITEACTCGGIPAHDHFAGHQLIDGVYRPVYTHDPVRIWVDWRAVARALMADPAITRRHHPADLTADQRLDLEHHATYLGRCGRLSLAQVLRTMLAGEPITPRQRQRLAVNADYLDRHGSPQRAAALRTLIGNAS